MEDPKANENVAEKTEAEDREDHVKPANVAKRVYDRVAYGVGAGTGAMLGIWVGNAMADPNDPTLTRISKLGAGVFGGALAGHFAKRTTDAIDDNTTVNLLRLEEERRRNAAESEKGGDKAPGR